MKSNSFDPMWETRYHDDPGYRNKYPWSSVVSFVFHSIPQGVERSSISILEVGCGTGSNLWFCAREGFRVAGIDGSETAIAYAKDWFEREGLKGDLRVGDFTKLPFGDASFDLVIDRGALSFAPMPGIREAVGAIRRVLRPGGKFLFTPYGDRCTSFDGIPDEDGCYRNVTGGSIIPGAQITFLGITDIRTLLSDGWQLDRVTHVEETDFNRADRLTHAEWHVEATKAEDTRE
jgi:SAM-dependent methyltransferase